MQLNIDFNQPSPSGYSYETSLPGYNSNPEDKLTQAERILNEVVRLKETCLLQLHEIMGIPQSTVSGRVNDLCKAGKIRYSSKEDYIMYKGMLRKKIILV